MDEQLRTQFTSWDGLEEDEISNLKGLIQSLTDLKAKQARGKTINRANEKKIQDETSKLTTITRSWARRPLPTTTKDKASLGDADRVKLRKVYKIVQEGLQDPTAASNPSFVVRLRNSCKLAGRIGPTDSDPTQPDGIPEDFKDIVMKDREDILEEAGRIAFSPAPSFEDIKEELDDVPVRECKVPFFVDEDIRSQYPWPDQEIEKARDIELDKGDLVGLPGEMYGTVRYIGRIKEGVEEIYVGVELSEEFAAMGTSGGDFDGKLYFTASSAKAAAFFPLSQVYKRCPREDLQSQLPPHNIASSTAEAPTCSTAFFYDATCNNGFLSQWYSSLFRHPDSRVEYFTAGHYMMHQKAILFGDEETASKILRTVDPRDVRDLGRKVEGFDLKLWEANRYEIAVRGSYNKFRYGRDKDSSNGSLRQRLLDTGDAKLVKASPNDRIWGIGYRESQAERNRDSWGMNLLGTALMQVRERLRGEVADEEELSYYNEDY